MSEKETKLMIIEAIDHFDTQNRDTEICIIRNIGEFLCEDENYIVLRHQNYIFEGKEGTEYLHKIIKKNIISKIIFEPVTGMVKA